MEPAKKEMGIIATILIGLVLGASIAAAILALTFLAIIKISGIW